MKANENTLSWSKKGDIMFKRIKKIIDQALLNALQKVEKDIYYTLKLDAKKQWDLETGELFNDLILLL
jgi:hypothetical protein